MPLPRICSLFELLKTWVLLITLIFNFIRGLVAQNHLIQFDHNGPMRAGMSDYQPHIAYLDSWAVDNLQLHQYILWLPWFCSPFLSFCQAHLLFLCVECVCSTRCSVLRRFDDSFVVCFPLFICITVYMRRRIWIWIWHEKLNTHNGLPSVPPLL